MRHTKQPEHHMKLLETFQLGAHTLQNHMVMAAMTRSRADSNGIVGEMTVAYYAQRASAGQKPSISPPMPSAAR